MTDAERIKWIIEMTEIFGGLTMMSKEEIEAEANEWIRSQGWSEETLPSDEYNQMVSAYVAGYYAG